MNNHLQKYGFLQLNEIYISNAFKYSYTQYRYFECEIKITLNTRKN